MITVTNTEGGHITKIYERAMWHYAKYLETMDIVRSMMEDEVGTLIMEDMPNPRLLDSMKEHRITKILIPNAER